MKRKAIQLAAKTIVVSLPSSWVKRNKISKGDDIELVDSGSFIKVSAGSIEPGEKKISISLCNATRTTTRAILSGIYKQGYDEITVEYNSKEVYDAIQEKRREVLLGFTIHEISKGKLLLGSFTKESPKEFETSLRRAFLVTISMGENLLDAIKKNDFKNLDEIRLGENTNNQLTSFCERLINKGFIDPGKASFYYVVCWNLEKVCDPYKEIIFLIEQCRKQCRKLSFSNDTLKLFEIANNFIKKYYDLIYNYSLAKAVNLEKDRKSIMEEVKTIYKNKNEFECQVINYLLEIISSTSNFSGPSSALNTDKLAQ